MMWQMYHKCKLVHADLSEYNMLYRDISLVLIDVSQSVKHDHPMALEFLRKDCTNIMNENNMDEYLNIMSSQVHERIDQESYPEQEINKQVFKQAYILQRLNQVIDVERDIKLAKTKKEDLIYKTLIGLKADLSKPNKTPEVITKKI
ncbi:hypothetical protein M0804_013504 [Polistes exclamans]|nr:hypothetical protein M0804_013504 [Polistes exclamans]